jgi:hypothetical protein
MLKVECVAILDKEIAVMESSLVSLRKLRETLRAESEVKLNDEPETIIPITDAGEGPDAGGDPAAEVVQVAAVESQGVDAAGLPITAGHPLFKQ